MAGQNYAFRKTIRPIRPKPLMPTSVSDMIRFNLYQPERVWFGKRLVVRERFGLCDVEGEGQIFVGIWETGSFSAGRGEARRHLFSTLSFFLLRLNAEPSPVDLSTSLYFTLPYVIIGATRKVRNLYFGFELLILDLSKVIT